MSKVSGDAWRCEILTIWCPRRLVMLGVARKIPRILCLRRVVVPSLPVVPSRCVLHCLLAFGEARPGLGLAPLVV